jgi:hypothetical protein
MKKLHEYKTPLTDEAWAAWPYAGPGVHANFARDLERKLALAMDAMRQVMDDIDYISWGTLENAISEIENENPQC